MYTIATTDPAAHYLTQCGSESTGFTFVKAITLWFGTGSGVLVVTGELTTNGSTDSVADLCARNRPINRNGGGAVLSMVRLSLPRQLARADPPYQFRRSFFNFNGAGMRRCNTISGCANALSLLPAPVWEFVSIRTEAPRDGASHATNFDGPPL